MEIIRPVIIENNAQTKIDTTTKRSERNIFILVYGQTVMIANFLLLRLRNCVVS